MCKVVKKPVRMEKGWVREGGSAKTAKKGQIREK